MAYLEEAPFKIFKVQKTENSLGTMIIVNNEVDDPKRLESGSY